MSIQQTASLPAVWRLESGALTFTFHTSGDLYEALGGGIMLNQLLSNPLDGSLNNLYLRIVRPEGFSVHPLLGVRSTSRISRGERRITWSGIADEIRYEVSFLLSSRNIWFWEVNLHSEGASVQAELIYGQDVGLGAPAAVRSNEAYCSQYIDHAAFRTGDFGWVVCSRQNQPQAGRFPYLQQGCLTGAAAFSTDGFQFFGLSFKDTYQPEALSQDQLPSKVYQYEFAYTALQSQRVNPVQGARVVFYGMFREDHPEAVTDAAFADELAAAWQEMDALPAAEAPANPMPLKSPDLGAPLQSRPLTVAELQERYPSRLEEEWADGELLSFFTPTYEHVVLKSKEMLVERPHGHILMSGAPDRAGVEMLTSTAYMYGIFHSHLVVGNTTFNKLLSNTRNALGAAHASGLRLYARVGGSYRLLAMPSLFEIGFNYARWIYRLDEDTLEITSYTSSDSPDAVLEVRSESGLPREYLITAQVTMSDREYEAPYELVEREGSLLITAAEGSPIREAYPGLSYRIFAEGTGLRRTDERRLMPSLVPGQAPLLVLETDAAASWRLLIGGRLSGFGAGVSKTDAPSFENEKRKYREDMAKLMKGFALDHPQGNDAVQRLNMLAWWYTHNMRVHFAVPHGLEQYGGAAWGTRDVCQGPAEYFLAVQHYEAVRDIIMTVYTHQYDSSGGWPQWFMFDRYHRVQQEESHGDIIVWPLKLLGDYIAATGDTSILETELSYTDHHTFELTEDKQTLYRHVQKQMDYIRTHFLHGTRLSAYGDGDWDDTLQPASAELRTFMVSSWTVALTYQAVRQLGTLLASFPAADNASKERAAFGVELLKLAEGISEDFHRYMNPDEIIPGFLYMEDPAHPDKWLHPTDTRTGIQYRLLPMTRSIIAGLITPEQAEAHYRLIKRELSFPDGVRLMNRPASYDGGVSSRFKRAEQAANFGREVGLQYVHAHIRFIEAMAGLGKSEEAWRALQVINPVGIQKAVPNAELRQSNAYFSSSDGKFASRYEAAERFDELRSGSAPVKGGWRIYSSGPGIYMNQLISNVLGIRQAAGRLQLDPVLPAELNGLSLRFAVAGRPVRIMYALSGSGSPISRITVNGQKAAFSRLIGPYRSTGAELSLEELETLWLPDAEKLNEIVIEA